MRDNRTPTNANSAATKNPFAATSTRTEISFRRVTVQLVDTPISVSAIKIPSQLLGSSSITKEARKERPICKSFPPEEANHTTAGTRKQKRDRGTGKKGKRGKGEEGKRKERRACSSSPFPLSPLSLSPFFPFSRRTHVDLQRWTHKFRPRFCS